MSNSVDPGSINKSESRKVDDEKNQPVALITGAAGGIGNGIIKTLASAGWRLLMIDLVKPCLLYTSPSPRDQRGSRMPSSA